MAGVGRKSDFGKSMYDDEEVENRLDTPDPFGNRRIPFEDRLKALMEKGVPREKAIGIIRQAEIDMERRKEEQPKILEEECNYRKETGDIKKLEDDEHCAVFSPGRKRKGADGKKARSQ